MIATVLLQSAWVTAEIAAGLGLAVWIVGVGLGLAALRRRSPAPVLARDPHARRGALAQVVALVTGAALIALTRGEAMRASPVAVQAGLAALAALAGPLGGMLGAWSVHALAHGDGLLTTGPFGIVRHPLYLSLVLVAGAVGLALGSVVGTAVMLALLVHASVLRGRREDAALAHAYGDAYAAYAARVHAFRPRI